MGVCRNCFGKPSYTATTKHGVFSITKGDKHILRHYPYMSTNAGIDVGLILPDELPAFDSFIDAVKFMKDHIDELR